MKKTASLAITLLLITSGFLAIFAYTQVAQASTGPVLYVAPAPTGTGTAGGSCTAPGFNTISAAIAAAAPGSTIKVCPGVYAEQIVITTSLTIKAAVVSSPPTIKAPSTTLAPDPLCVTYATSPGCSPAITDVVDISGPGVSVTMTNLIVSGPGPSGCWSIEFGVFVYGGANLVMRNSQITNIEDTPFSGCQNGVAIQVGWSTALGAPVEEVGTATLSGVNINNYQKNGITVDGAGSTLTMTHSIVTGKGAQATNGQNGIQISDAANANIIASVISGDEWTATAAQNPSYPSGSNIETDLQSPCVLLYSGGGATVIRNDIMTSCDADIFAFATNGGSSMSILSNQFVNPTYYGAVLEDSNLTLISNRFIGGLYGVAAVADSYGTGTTTSGTLVRNSFVGQTAGSLFTWALPSYQVTMDLK